MRGILAGALLLPGCWTPGFADCSVQCGAGGICPAETTCSGGFCVRTGQPSCGGSSEVDAPVDGAATVDVVAVDAEPVIYRDCLDARDRGTTVDGVVTIDLDGAGAGMAPFQAYCDQTTAGGGWTLVYVYTFTNYGNFSNNGNAVTPRPTWPYSSSGTSTPTSTTIPLSPTSLGALDFSRWQVLGGEFLVTSNINHWVSCRPMNGDLTRWTEGAIDCTIERLIATDCTDVVPTNLQTDAQGPSLRVGGFFYYFEASVQSNWPTHDPCGSNGMNHVHDVGNPGGAVYLRRSP